MEWKLLDKDDTSLYKAMAILMIVTHNFMHLFPSPKEIQFGFLPDNFLTMLSMLGSEPEKSIQILMAFFGHFGVQIFIFLSAYGFTKKYSSLEIPRYWSFIRERFVKFYPVFIMAIIFYVVMNGWYKHGVFGPLKMLYWNLEDIALRLSLLSNFFPDKGFVITGPWWFISAIFQFYLIFPPLLWLYSRWGNIALIILSIVSIIFVGLVHGEVGGVNLHLTVVGHLPVFLLGMYLAKNDSEKIRIPITLMIVATISYLLGNIYEIFWYVNNISFLVILLAFFNFVIPAIKKRDNYKKLFLFLGSISMHLFLAHGFLRSPLIKWAIKYDHWFLTLLLCMLFVLFSVLIAYILSRAERQYFKYISNVAKPYTSYQR